MEITSKAKKTIARVVEDQRAKQGPFPWDTQSVELVVDNSDIIIAELNQTITNIAHNLGTTKDKVEPWSKDVGEALTLMDQLIAELESKDAAIDLAAAYLKTAQNIPADQSTSGYVANSLELLNKVKGKT